LGLLGLVAVIVLIRFFGASFSAVVWVFWLQSFEACIEAFLSGYGFRFYGCFYRNHAFNYLVINNLIFTVMVQHLLFANKTYDTVKQEVEKNQIIWMNEYEDDRYVIYDITEGDGGLIYRLINLRTHGSGSVT
jgi:hypothetical protein